MKLGVVGTFICDKIYNYHGQIIESLGGITYTLAVLANLLSEQHEIFPIANVGEDSYENIINFLKRYPQIKFDHLNKVNHKNTQVTLKYKDKYTRDEFLKNILPEIEYKQLKKAEDLDLLLINFITGFELTQQTCNKICKESTALVCMDFHSLSLGIDEQGKRYLKKPENWENWIKNVDILQMNEYEALLLAGNKKLEDFGNYFKKFGVQIINITLGSKGSLLFYQNKGKYIQKHIPVHEVGNVVDVTGCGDAFMGGFIVSYLNNKNVLTAANFANKVAGINSTFCGTNELKRLANL